MEWIEEMAAMMGVSVEELVYRTFINYVYSSMKKDWQTLLGEADFEATSIHQMDDLLAVKAKQVAKKGQKKSKAIAAFAQKKERYIGLVCKHCKRCWKKRRRNIE